MSISIDLRVGETLQIGEVVLTLEKKSGQLARLSVNANASVKVSRLPERIQRKTHSNAK